MYDKSNLQKKFTQVNLCRSFIFFRILLSKLSVKYTFYLYLNFSNFIEKVKLIILQY